MQNTMLHGVSHSIESCRKSCSITPMPVALPVDWEAIRFDFEHKNLSFNELSQKYSVKQATLRRRSERECWNQHKKAAERVAAQLVSPPPHAIARAQERVLTRSADMIAEFVSKAVVQAQSIMNAGADLVSQAHAMGDARAARDAAAAWAIGHQGARQSLGLDRDTHGRETPWAQSPIIDVTPLPASQSVIDVGSNSPQPTGEGAGD